jgi:hypothetical protein
MSRVPIGTQNADAGTDDDWLEAWVGDFARWCAECGDDEINWMLDEAAHGGHHSRNHNQEPK